MERQRGIGYSERFAQLARRCTLFAQNHQGTKYLQAIGLSQGCKSFKDVFFFHVSIMIEICDKSMTPFQQASDQKTKFTEQTAIHPNVSCSEAIGFQSASPNVALRHWHRTGPSHVQTRG